MQRARVTQLTPKKGQTCRRTSPDNLEKLEDKKGAWNPGRGYAARGGRGAGNLHRRGGREGPRAGCDVIEPDTSLAHESLLRRPAHEDPRSCGQRDAKERSRQDLRGEPLLCKTLRRSSPRR